MWNFQTPRTGLQDAGPIGRRSGGAHPIPRVRVTMPSTAELPDDPRLPALAAIRDRLGQVIPERELGDGPVEIRLCNHVPGSRATFEVRTGERRLALKAYAEDPTPEAELYRHLARVGLDGGSSARVPRLVAGSQQPPALALQEAVVP